MSMKCPVCGDEVRNGRCSFCGYRPTAEDASAAARWKAQKAVLENGGPPPPERARAAGRPAKPAGKAPPAKPARPARPAAPARKAPPAKPAGPARKAAPAKPARRAGKHGLLQGLLFKLVFSLWLLGFAWSLYSAWAAESGQDPLGALLGRMG